MNLLNTTFCMAEPSVPAFLRWMKEVYRPAAEIYGDDIKLLKIPAAEAGTATFGLQFTVGSDKDAETWAMENLDRLTALAAEAPYNLGKEQLVHFTTVMEIL